MTESSIVASDFLAGRRTSWSRLGVAAVALLVALLITARAPCQPAADATLAETLFQVGKQLLQEKRYAEACPKLQESLRLDAATGTLIALAICHEAEGKTASAWAEFSEGAAAAAREGRTDRVEFAQERAHALAPRLARLVVNVPPELQRLSGVQIKRDGVELGAAIWGSAIPVDPGPHRIEASAPRMQPWSAVIEVKPDGARQIVDVPPLQLRQASSSPPPGARQRTIGWVVGGGGLVALGVGSYFGLRAIANHDEATSRCSPLRCTDREAVRLNDDAKVSASISNVGIGIGLAGVAASAILVLTAPKRPDRLAASLVIAPGMLNLVLTP